MSSSLVRQKSQQSCGAGSYLVWTRRPGASRRARQSRITRITRRPCITAAPAGCEQTASGRLTRLHATIITDLVAHHLRTGASLKGCFGTLPPHSAAIPTADRHLSKVKQDEHRQPGVRHIVFQSPPVAQGRCSEQEVRQLPQRGGVPEAPDHLEQLIGALGRSHR